VQQFRYRTPTMIGQWWPGRHLALIDAVEAGQDERHCSRLRNSPQSSERKLQQAILCGSVAGPLYIPIASEAQATSWKLRPRWV
jgi:hypothetical protein